MARKTFKPVTQLFKRSSRIVRDNLGIFIFVNLVSILSAAWSIGTQLKDKTGGYSWGTVFRDGIFGSDQNTPRGSHGPAALIVILAAIILQLMASIVVVRAAAGKRLVLADIWDEFKIKWLRILGVSIVTGLFIIVGFILFIIPGILLLPRLIMAPFLLIDQNTGIREAINKSWDLAEGGWDKIYAVVLFGLVLSLPGFIPVIGPIISTALTILFCVALPMRYFELKADN